MENLDPELNEKLLAPFVIGCDTLYSYSYTDIEETFGDCQSASTLKRLWKADNGHGVIYYQNQLITINPMAFGLVEFPSDISLDNAISCNFILETTEEIEEGNLFSDSELLPEKTGLPQVDGILLSNELLAYCQYSMSFTDSLEISCPGSYIIHRTFEINNNCVTDSLSGQSISQSQRITVIDDRGPELVAEFEEVKIDLVESECFSNAALPLPIYMADACSQTQFEISSIPQGSFIVNGTPQDADFSISADSLDMGTYTVTYLYTDECGNTNQHEFVLTVGSVSAPDISCKEQVDISFQDGDTTAIVTIDDILESVGTDACGTTSTTKIIRARDFNNGVILTNITDTLYVDGQLVYEAKHGCNTDGVISDTIFSSDGGVIFIEELSYVIPKDTLSFCCTDIGDQGVLLLVTDSEGNVNSCRTTISIEDSGNIELSCTDYEVSCSSDLETNILMPEYQASACNSAFDIEYVDDETNLSLCGGGEVIRSWFVDQNENNSFDSLESSCQQIITVSETAAFDPYSIKWPAHADGNMVSGISLSCNADGGMVETAVSDILHGTPAVCEAPQDTIKAIWCDAACSLISSTVNEEIIELDNGCQALRRRHMVIDWCVWEAGGKVADGTVSRSAENFEAVRENNESDCIQCADSTSIEAINTVYYRFKQDSVILDGFYSYDQIISIIDDTAPVISVSALIQLSCASDFVINATASDECGGAETNSNDLVWTIELYDPSGDIIQTRDGKDSTVIFGPTGVVGVDTERLGSEFTIKWQVSDACGNVTEENTSVNYNDTTAPTLLCYQDTISIEMEADSLMIGPGDLAFSLSDDCTTSLDYAITSQDEQPLLPGETGFEDNLTRLLTCEDIGTTFSLDLHAWDSSSNTSSCRVAIEVIGECPSTTISTAIIAGAVYTANNEMVSDVRISLDPVPPLQEYPMQRMTSDDGLYAFPDNPKGFNYFVSADKVDDNLNGVSTIDIVLIQKHIVGLSELTNPYQVIAADVNNDNQITGLDLIELRNIILKQKAEFNGQNWRFVNSSQEFNNPYNPWPLEEIIEVNDLQEDMMEQMFIAIKTGDVSQNAVVNSNQLSEIRNQGTLTFVIKDQLLNAGQEIQVPVRALNFDNIYGCQFTMTHPGIHVTGIEAASASFGESNMKAESGKTLISWNDVQGVSSSDELFYITFKAEKPILLSESLTFNSEHITAEAYQGKTLRTINVALDFESDHTEFEIFQNQPNPFTDYTAIPFKLPESGEVGFRLFDESGKTVMENRQYYEKGYHEIKLEARELKGMYYYEITNGYQKHTKKLVVIK